MPVIKVENLSKQYRLGTVGTGTLSHDLNRWWHRVRGKEDPYLKVGEANDRATKGTSEYVWALRDINFEVEQGEVLGIIGKNGSGKSTLLKILSRVTRPTTGSFKVRGRVASLLEVGTGFHPELSGRENIFLNGAILGMSKAEIRRKFDEIVDFSGVERYIDTPVKRYSSGMYVRLAFAVAAHLEPEILIVDEVLAVGDAEFQKKCLGKMKDVSGEGRTVLFVSHNMTAVNSLCKAGLFMRNGRIEYVGSAKEAVDLYLKTDNAIVAERKWTLEDAPGDDVAKLLEARLIDGNHQVTHAVDITQRIGIEYKYRVLQGGEERIPNVHIYNKKGECVFVSGAPAKNRQTQPREYVVVAWIPEHLLNDGTYLVGLALSTMSPLRVHFFAQETLVFDVIEDISQRPNKYNQSMPGVIRPNLLWESKVDEFV